MKNVLNLTTAKKMLNDVVAGKMENTKDTMDSIFKFASEQKVTLIDMLNKNNVTKALALGLIKPPSTLKGEKVSADLKVQAQNVLDKKAEIAEKAKAEKFKFDSMNSIIKAHTVARPSTLFRIVWKEGRNIVGMEVFHVHPIARKSPNLIGMMLEWDKDEKSFKKLDVIGSIDVSSLEWDGKKPVVYDSNGDSCDLGIYLPKPAEPEKVEVEKPKAKRTVKPKVDKPVVETKEEGKKEGE